MRRAGRLNAAAMQAVAEAVKPGVTTAALDALAVRVIRNGGGEPLFLGYRGYPANICASVNAVVVHGIPGDRPLREGDIVSIDLGTTLEGWCADMARTFPVGRISPEAEKLIRITEECFWTGFALLHTGRRVGDVASAVQRYAEERGYGVVRALTGHGIGRRMHESPSLPNFGEPGRGAAFKPGMVVALEPMITAGTWQVETAKDGWTTSTLDGRLAAHYENTVCITGGEPEILTVT